MTSTIVIEVNGGVLTEVHNLPLGCRVMLIDWDDIDSDPGLFWREASNEQREFIKKEDPSEVDRYFRERELTSRTT